MLFDTNIKVLLSESQSLSLDLSARFYSNPSDKMRKFVETLRKAAEQL